MTDHRRRVTRSALALLLLAAAPVFAQSGDAPPPAAPGGGAPASGGEVEFHHVLDGRKIELTYKPEQQITEAVASFHKTAQNPYNDNPDAVAEGKKLYDQWCAACHLKDATGRIGPNLIDNDHLYPQTATDKGMFEIVYAGGAGAMQAFGRRMTQDQILKVLAYVKSLKQK
ncbi:MULTISPECIES: c-type cytochrome [Rhodomicrobium]|uniref:c-type cytochrome n=1 Tax=Rhodomicrobium TaxID=1068 RepID=UPI000B4B3C6C|nr:MULTISPECIES: c-type cytochrome [Rhodomicrobium]